MNVKTLLNKLKSDYRKDLKPALDTLLSDFATDNTITDFTWQTKIDDEIVQVVGLNATTGNTIHQIYPKVVFSGSNNQNEVDFNFAFDTLIGHSRQEIINFLIANNGENVWTHLHYSWGSVDLDELF